MENNNDLSTITISTEVLEKFRIFVFGKHKKLRGKMRLHAEKAILNYIENEISEK